MEHHCALFRASQNAEDDFCIFCFCGKICIEIQERECVHFSEYNNWILLRQMEKSGKRKRRMCVGKSSQVVGCVLRGLCVFLELKKSWSLSHSALVPFSVKGG